MPARSAPSATDAPFGSLKSRSNCFGMLPLIGTEETIEWGADCRLAEVKPMLSRKYGTAAVDPSETSAIRTAIAAASHGKTVGR